MPTRDIKTRFTLDGEKAWKQEMTQVNGHLKSLKSELALSSSEFRGQANSMEALTSKQKILQQQYEQQREKVRAYRDALSEIRGSQERYAAAIDAVKTKAAEAGIPLEKLRGSTKGLSEDEMQLASELQAAERGYDSSIKKGDEYRQSLSYAQIQLNDLDDSLQKNQEYILEAQKASDGHAKSIDEFGREVKDASNETRSFGDVLKANLTSEAIISGLKAMASAIKSAGAALKDAVVDAAAYADEVMTDSVVTGLSTDALQEYRYMAELTDTSVDTITGSLSKLTKNMSSAKGGSGAAAEAFAALGISVTDANGELRNNQEVFGDVIDALGQMENETQRDAYSMAIFGRSAQDLNPLIAQGADGIAAFAQEAHDMGYVLDEETLQSLGAVDDSMQRFQNVLEATKNKVSAEFAPGVTSVFDGLTAILSGDMETGVDLIETGIDQIGMALEKMGPYAEVALKLLINTIIDSLPEIINTGASLLESLINGICKAMPELIPTTINLIMEIVYTLLDNVDLLISAAIQLTIGIATGLIRAIPTLVSKLPQIISAIVRGLISGASQLSDVGSQLIRGLWNGISNMGAWIGEKIRGFGQGIVSSLKSFFGIHSPSTLMRDQVGHFLGQGVTEGFVDSVDEDAMRAAIPTNFDIAAEVHSAARLEPDTYAAQAMAYDTIANLRDDVELLRELRNIRASLDELKRMGLYLDGDRLVGGLTPKMDVALGKLKRDRERGC